VVEVTTIQTTIQTRLQKISGLRVYDVWPDQVTPPCAIVRTPTGDYDDDYDGDYTVGAEVILLAASAQLGLAKGQRLLDPYLAPRGAQSVKAAIEDDSDGAEGSFRVVGWRDKGTLVVNGVEYVGCRLPVEVMA
jgi:hypothetical protein